MKPPSQRPARYSVRQLRVIADRLRAPLKGAAPVFLMLSARRERFVRAVDIMDRGYEGRGPRSTNLRDLHQNIGRAFRELFHALEAMRRLPSDFDGQAVAAQVVASHFRHGLAFTQKPVVDLVPDATDRAAALSADPRLSLLSENIAHRVRNVVASLDIAPPSVEAPPSGALGAAIRVANMALHAYARLVEECTGIELTDEEAHTLRRELAADDDLPMSI